MLLRFSIKSVKLTRILEIDLFEDRWSISQCVVYLVKDKPNQGRVDFLNQFINTRKFTLFEYRSEHLSIHK